MVVNPLKKSNIKYGRGGRYLDDYHDPRRHDTTKTDIGNAQINCVPKRCYSVINVSRRVYNNRLVHNKFVFVLNFFCGLFILTTQMALY